MTKCTSKAAYLEERQTGRVLSQEEKILDIINVDRDFSLQEIMAVYRDKHGNIELSSVAARCNSLKKDKKIFEGDPRKCSLTKKRINPLSANKCTHEFYKTNNFMQYEKAVKDPNICWTGMIEKTCKDCGQDIGFARRVQVKTVDQYMRGI